MSESGIRMVIGRPGGGKTFYAVRSIVYAVLRGEPVATNVPLTDGWQHEVAKMRGGRWHSDQWRQERAEQLVKLVYLVYDFEELLDLRLPRCGRCKGCKSGRRCRKEGRGLIVLDEAADWVGRRLWNVKKHEDDSPVERRERINKFFRKHRKRGWAVCLISQSEKLVDNQLQELPEQFTVLRNIRRIPHLANPLMWLRYDLFCATTFWGMTTRGPNAIRARTEWFTLNKRIANLYDTMGGFDPEDDELAETGVWPWGGSPVRELGRDDEERTANDDQEDDDNEKRDQRDEAEEDDAEEAKGRIEEVPVG